jgi:hypothetical protein
MHHDTRSRKATVVVTLFLAAGLLLGPALAARAQQLYVDPAVSIPSEYDFTVAVAIDNPGNLLITGVDVEMAYDPGIVQRTGIMPGPWVTGSGLPFSFFDWPEAPAGELHFTLAFLGGSRGGSGTVAVFHFTALAEGDSPLDFTLVDVRDPSNQYLGFGHSTGDLIQIRIAVSGEPSTLGRVKALYRQ